jgi:hypothetical protein
MHNTIATTTTICISSYLPKKLQKTIKKREKLPNQLHTTTRNGQGSINQKAI